MNNKIKVMIDLTTDSENELYNIAHIIGIKEKIGEFFVDELFNLNLRAEIEVDINTGKFEVLNIKLKDYVFK